LHNQHSASAFALTRFGGLKRAVARHQRVHAPLRRAMASGGGPLHTGYGLGAAHTKRQAFPIHISIPYCNAQIFLLRRIKKAILGIRTRYPKD
jgi:hypothetical protein